MYKLQSTIQAAQHPINLIKPKGERYDDSFEEFAISYEPVRSGTYNVYMFGNIVSAAQFVGTLEVLRIATENDSVVIHLQTNGGSIEATDTLLQAMKECEGQVVVRASGGVHSAGTAILLAAQSFTLSENAHFLIHNGSVGNVGKFSDYKSQATADIEYMERFLKNVYHGFLSETEIEDMLRGVDIWLNRDQFIERSDKRNEYYKAKMEAMEADMTGQIAALLAQNGMKLESNDEPEIVAEVVVKPPRNRKKAAPK